MSKKTIIAFIVIVVMVCVIMVAIGAVIYTIAKYS